MSITQKYESNIELDWNNITREELKELSYNRHWSDSIIAEHFNVSVSSVRYKRKKLKLTRADIMYEDFVNGNQELINSLNQSSLEWFLDESNIDLIAKCITNYIFRAGPVEKIHSDKDKNLTDADMKTLNVFMVNQIAGLLQYALNGDWMRLRTVLDVYSSVVGQWQAVEPDLEVIKKMTFPVEKVDEKIIHHFKVICSAKH